MGRDVLFRWNDRGILFCIGICYCFDVFILDVLECGCFVELLGLNILGKYIINLSLIIYIWSDIMGLFVRGNWVLFKIGF